VRRIDYGNDTYILPYIDGADGAEEYDADWLMLCEGGDITVESTNGTSRSGSPCGWCNDHTESDISYVESVSEDVCEDCIDRDFRYIPSDGEYHPDNNVHYSDDEMEWVLDD